MPTCAVIHAIARRDAWTSIADDRALRFSTTSDHALEEALPVVILGHSCPHALTIIGVGLAVAAAHGEEDQRTEPRHPRAGAASVCDQALSGRFLTEQAGVALMRMDDEAAACLAD